MIGIPALCSRSKNRLGLVAGEHSNPTFRSLASLLFALDLRGLIFHIRHGPVLAVLVVGHGAVAFFAAA